MLYSIFQKKRVSKRPRTVQTRVVLESSVLVAVAGGAAVGTVGPVLTLLKLMVYRERQFSGVINTSENL